MKVCVSVHGRFHAFELASGLQARGALARLLTTYPGFAVAKLAGRALPVKSAWWLEVRRRLPGLSIEPDALASAFGRFAAANLAGDADLLVGWSSATLEAIEPARRRGMKVVIERGSTHIAHQTEVLTEAHDMHGLPFAETPREIIERELAEYEMADAISVPTAFAAGTFAERGIPERKMLVNPYGVDLGRFKPVDRAGRGRPVRIVFVGRVGVRKGVPDLLKAFAPLAGEAELILVGPLEPGMETILGQAPAAGVAVRGAVPAAALPAIYGEADIFCLPSLEEGFAMVLLQAMACGLPVVATPESGAADVITDGVEGRLVPSGDPAALTDALAALCTDGSTRRRMGAAARARVENGWGWNDYADRAVAIYESLLR